MEAIKDIELAAVTGGVDWSAAHQQGKAWAKEYAGIAWQRGRPIGTLLGAGGGYAAGFGKGVYDTWDK